MKTKEQTCVPKRATEKPRYHDILAVPEDDDAALLQLRHGQNYSAPQCTADAEDQPQAWDPRMVHTARDPMRVYGEYGTERRVPRPPNVSLLRALWSLLDGI